jgi:DNA-binding transcriptional MerR regulator
MNGEGQDMTDKAPDAFRTISEVADDLDLPQHVLRFWETRFSQIKPLKRGGGRRYYRPDDVLLLRGIRRLLYGEGYTIKGVQRILKENGVRAVQLAGQEGLPDGQTFAPPSASPEERFEDEALDEAALEDEERTHDVAPSAPWAAEGDYAAALDQPVEVDEQPEDDAPVAAPGPAVEPLPAPAAAPAAPERYVPSPHVSIVRGGLPRQLREGAASGLDRRASQPGAPRFSTEDIQTLKAVLFELIEVRKTLDLAVNRS